MTKTEKTKTEMICGSCGMTFTGKKCPECGNVKGNRELAHDGIPQDEHSPDRVFGSARGLQPEGEALTAEYLMSRELAKGQQEDLQDNLRESFVIKSELKRLELEAKLKERKGELAPPHVPQAAPPQPESQPMQIPSPFQQPGLGPQAQFMNQFMKMNVDDRTEFLDQLAEADPQALTTLSGFFAQQQQQVQPQMAPNPYGPPPVNPYMQYPPYMQQQQQFEPQAAVVNPIEGALAMVDKLQQMSEKNQNGSSPELTAILGAIREDQKIMNDRMDAMSADRQNNENDAIMNRLGQIETKVFTPQPALTVKDQLHGIKEMVSDLRDIGMITEPESKNTVEEQIKLDQAKHSIKKEDREIDLEEQRLAAVKADREMRENLVSGMFNRHLHKSMEEDETPGVPAQTQPFRSQPPSENRVIYDPQPAATIVEEFRSDAGTVRETKRVSDVDDGPYCEVP